MNTPETIDVTPEPTQALAVRETQAVGAILPPEHKAQTPQELRVMEVSEALLPAYQKASTLELTDAEIDALQKPFADQDVEIRPHDGLIYLPHILISDRLNQVFKPGRWALMCRRHWLEGTTMYGEYVMVVRGCYVGESIGGHPYQPNNPKANYSDTLESTAAEALRRIAGKRLSCGSQVWHPEYARQWLSKYGYQQNGKWHKRSTPAVAPSAPAPTPAPRQSPPPPAPTAAAAQPQAVQPPASGKPAIAQATAKTREWMLGLLSAGPGGPARDIVQNFFVAAGIIMPVEGVDDIPLRWVATSKPEVAKLSEAIDAFATGGDAKMPYASHGPAPATTAKKPIEVPREPQAEVVNDVDSDDAPWRAFPMPFGKNAGTPLGELEKKYLFGLWANYTVETEYNGKAKKPETIAKDRLFREMLDQAGEHHKFEKRD